MIEFLGLEWDPACLEFHANRRVVRTPSLVQVRQPIHTRSVGRWRNYEPYLRPLLRACERYGVDPLGLDPSRFEGLNPASKSAALLAVGFGGGLRWNGSVRTRVGGRKCKATRCRDTRSGRSCW